MNVAIFWDIVPFSPYVNCDFGEMYHLHLQGKNQPNNKPACSLVTCFALVSCLADFTLTMEVVCSSETLVNVRTMQCYIPEMATLKYFCSCHLSFSFLIFM
jgi:hypothetical protein